MDLLTEPSTSTENSKSTSSTENPSKYTNPDVVVREDEVSDSSEVEEVENQDDVQTYEGVAADDFEQFAEQVIPALEGGAAALFVLVWAVFFCAGIMSVQTLVRSLEG